MTDIVVHYKIKNLVYHNGWFYMEITRGMYGLQQAGIIINN